MYLLTYAVVLALREPTKTLLDRSFSSNGAIHGGSRDQLSTKFEDLTPPPFVVELFDCGGGCRVRGPVTTTTTTTTASYVMYDNHGAAWRPDTNVFYIKFHKLKKNSPAFLRRWSAILLSLSFAHAFEHINKRGDLAYTHIILQPMLLVAVYAAEYINTLCA